MTFFATQEGTLFRIKERETKKTVFVAFNNGHVEGFDLEKYSITNYWPIFINDQIDDHITKLLDAGFLEIPGPIRETRYKWLKYLWLSLKPWGRKNNASLRLELLRQIFRIQRADYFRHNAGTKNP